MTRFNRNRHSYPQQLLRTAMLGLMMVWLLLSTTACGQAKDIWEKRTMQHYATAEFEWGMGVSTYGLDAFDENQRVSSPSIEAILPWNNEMLDLDGKVLARVDYTGGGGWGYSGGILGKEDSKKRLPTRLKMLYYDAQEKQAYQIDAPLPTYQIYELFKQGFVDLSGQKLNYNEIQVGLAPRGNVVVWVKEAAFMVEVASLQAQKVTLDAQTLEAYKNFNANIGLYDMNFAGAWRPDTAAKIKAGTEPDPTPYIKKRIHYPWKFGYVNANTSTEVEYYRATINEERMMIWSRLMPQEQTKLKPLPRWLDIYFNDVNDGKRQNLDVRFYTKDRVYDEPDTSELQAIFERWYPNRTPEQNDEIVPESEFAQFEFEWDMVKKETFVFVRKGNERIELKSIKVKARALPPNSYDGRPVNEYQLKNMRTGFTEKAYPHEICSKSGLYKCQNHNIPYEMTFLSGDILPLPSGLADGIDPDSIYWEWVRDLKTDEVLRQT